MAQTQRITGRATAVFTDTDGALCVVYHSTVVAKRNKDGTVTLNSGGWRTANTKTRMNQFSNQFCGGAFMVTQDKGAWYVRIANPKPRTEYESHRMDFADGITFAVPA